MFKREGDVSTYPEFNAVAIVGLIAALGAYGAGFAPAAFLISSVACLLGIGALKEVESAATGNWVGLLGVVGAVAATMAQIGLGGGLAQAALTYGGVGLALGAFVGVQAEVTDSPHLAGTAAFFVLGFILAAQVGGGDMPIVITLLN